MTPRRPGVRRLFRFDGWRHGNARRDTHDEIELHVALRAAELIRNGMAPRDADLEARRLFAVRDTTIDELYHSADDRNWQMRMHERWDAIRDDMRFAIRRFRREPAIAAFIIGTLAIGIGINVTTFSIADRILRRGPQHVLHADRLVRAYREVNFGPPGSRVAPWLPYTTFTTLRDGMRTVSAVAAYRVDDAMLGAAAAAERKRLSRVSGELFDLLGVRAERGRFFNPADGPANVAVVSDGYWRNVLGGSQDVIGKLLTIDDAPYTIIGVAPPGFTGPELGRVDAWAPITASQKTSTTMGVVMRLRDGVSAAAVTADIEHLRPAIVAAAPKWGTWIQSAAFSVAPIAYGPTGRESLESVMAKWLAAMAAAILVISCANVANLLLARIARRRRELAVRVALGSGRARLVRLFVIEGFLLAVLAALAAIAVVAITEPIVQNALFPQGAWAFSFGDPAVVGAIIAFALATGVLISTVPAWQAVRRNLGDLLRSGMRGGEARSPLRSGLTIVQAMLSVVLLVSAGLFVRSMQRVHAVNLGIEPDRVLTAELTYPPVARAPGETFNDWLARAGLLERQRHQALVEVARRIPGVERAAVTVGVPFNGSFSVSVWVPGRDSLPSLPGGGPFVNAVGSDYFATIGTPIHRGRAFTADDREGTDPVVIVSEAMARTLWPGRDPIGECLVIFARDAGCSRVVGVAADVHRSGLREDPSMQYYLPIGQERGFSGSYLILRPRAGTTLAWSTIRDVLEHADPAIRAIDIHWLSEGLAGQIRPYRLGLMAFGLAALLALIVAGLGLYSVMAHGVAWRRHEIGVRMALGARSSSIATLVMRRGALLATIGIALGIVIVVATRRWLEPQLFDTRATDPGVLLAVCVTLESVALFAGWFPARRAVRVSPTEALHAE